MSRPIRVYRSEAVVLKAQDYGEADRILTLYTPAHGKVRAIAKGVRRTKSRTSGHVDLFTRSNLLIAVGRQLDIITQAETVETFAGLRRNLWHVAQATYIVELVEGFSAEQLANHGLYTLLIDTLRRLATGDDPFLAVRACELQLLGLTGYQPQLFRCLHCNERIEPGSNRFSARLGGVLCPACEASDRTAAPVSVDALKVMRNLQTNEQAMLRVGPLAQNVQREVEKRLQEYIVYRLERRVRSVTFLDRLRSDVFAPPQS